MRDGLATCARSAENSKFAGGHCGWLDQLLIVCSKVMTTDCHEWSLIAPDCRRMAGNCPSLDPPARRVRAVTDVTDTRPTRSSCVREGLDGDQD
jgi:hypothetical protein